MSSVISLKNASPKSSRHFSAGPYSLEGAFPDGPARSSKRSAMDASVATCLAVCVLLTLTACSTNTQRPDNERRVAPLVSSAGQTLPDGSIRHDTDNARVAQLWSAAETARKKQDLATAEEYILEALKVKPQDAVLLSRVAEFKLVKLEPALAENFAAKSIAFAASNRTLLHRNWLIIEHARELRGDLLGVRDAHKMVQNYQY